MHRPFSKTARQLCSSPCLCLLGVWFATARYNGFRGSGIVPAEAEVQKPEKGAKPTSREPYTVYYSKGLILSGLS